MPALTNKVAIVTGASSGIGRAAAKLFAAEGAKVVVAARRRRELDTLVGEIARSGGEAIACAGDVRDEALHVCLVETALRDFSAFLAAKHQIPLMLDRRGGSLIFTSTFVGHTAGMPGVASYAASKAGLIGLTQALAAEFGPKGIRVNAILPGGTDTPMAQAMIGTPEGRHFVEGMHALKRIAIPEEIAKSVLYLASDASSFTTGTAMLVDGGVSINRT